MQKKKYINYRFIFYPFLAFLLGINVARFLYGGDLTIIITICLLLISLIVSLILMKKVKLLICLVALFFVGNGFFYIGQACYYIKPYTQTVSVVARVSDKNFVDEDFYYHIVLDNVTVDGESAKNISAFVSKDYVTTLEVGDKISFEGKIQSINLFTLKSFNSNYYRSNIGYTTSFSLENAVVLDGWRTIDENIRLAVKEQIDAKISPENAQLCYAVLFGDQSGIDEEIENNYRNSGIIHILTVSGLHVSFLISLVFGFLKLCKVNKFVNFGLTTAFIVFYAFLCGWTPSVLRAGIMAIVMMISWICGRKYDSLNSIAIAGFIICIFSPLTALDTGFLMSVFCVLGIALLYPFFFKIFIKFLPFWASQYLSLSLSAQISIMPFLAMFGSVYNLLSCFVNLIIVPIFSIVFPYLFVFGLVSAIVPALSFFLVPCDFCWTFINKLAQFFSSTSLQIQLNAFSFAVIVFIFILLFLISCYFMEKPINKFLLCSVVIFCISCAFGFSFIKPIEKPNVVYLNSYGEECMIVTNSNSEVLLVGNNYILDRYVNNYGLNHIDFYLSFDQVSHRDVKELEKYNIYKYICLEGDNSIDEIEIVSTSDIIYTSNFTIRYYASGDAILGSSISFDDVSIFIACQTNSRYNTIYEQLFSSISPTLIFTGDNLEIGGGFNVVSNDYGQYSKYCYQNDGNIKLTFNETNLIFGRLD